MAKYFACKWGITAPNMKSIQTKTTKQLPF